MIIMGCKLTYSAAIVSLCGQQVTFWDISFKIQDLLYLPVCQLASRFVYKDNETMHNRHPVPEGLTPGFTLVFIMCDLFAIVVFDILAGLKLYRGKPVIFRGHSFAFWHYGPIIVVWWSRVAGYDFVRDS